jgi:hypothetical protein
MAVKPKDRLWNKDKENLWKNNDGQVQFFLENAFRIGFLMIALLIFFLLISFYINNKIDTNRLQAEVLANRIIYSDIIMYQDTDTGRVYPGIVDSNRFNDDNIGKSIDYQSKRHAAAKMTIASNDGKITDEAYLSKAQYDNLLTLSRGGTGTGSATEYVKQYPITYYKNGVYMYSTLTLSIIIPNS